MPLSIKVDFSIERHGKAIAEIHPTAAGWLQGITIGAHNLLIAATALAHGWAFAMSNPREFARVPGLELR